jgi:glycosyltransferase involved in cell wall biosynthesis
MSAASGAIAENAPCAAPAAAGALRIDLGIFAYNEEAGIGRLLEDLARQDLCARPGIDLRVLVLANGCRDATVARAAAAGLAGRLRVDITDDPEGGKSRTWNRFVHRESRPDAEILVFMDGDIELPEPGTLGAVIDLLAARPELTGASSWPVKDIDYRPQKLGLVERLISMGGGTLDGEGVRHAICGQFYALRGAWARGLHLPVGLPVEDGFLGAMVGTDLWSEGPRPKRMDRPDGARHLYESERRMGSLLRHQTRIVIGSAINSAIFRHLSALRAREGQGAIAAELARAAADPDWLGRVLKAELPDRRYGFVPWHFLNKRVVIFWRSGRFEPKRALVVALGFGLDLVVWIRAQAAMARGAGVGFW